VITPQIAIAGLDRAIARYGQGVTLQRLTPDPVTGVNTVTETRECPAAIRAYGPQDLEAGEVVDIRVYLSPTSLVGWGLPRRDDKIIIHADPASTDTDTDTSRIVQVAPMYLGGTLCRVELLCRG
jgi:hypothetical protein